MSATFNVLERGWIPVVDSGGHRELLGIREVLALAHELREISDPSPLEEYSAYRFLGLFLMDALHPRKKSSVRTILQAGRFDMEQIEAYIALCQSEGVTFDLFDEERPFLQSRFDEKTDGSAKPVSVLDCTLPSGNNHTHFIHGSAEKLSPDRAARLLLTAYWFCTAAAQGYPSGVYGAPPYFGVIKGGNLFETLTSLLIPTDSIGIPFDKPPVLWRRKEPVVSKAEIGATSWLQGLLFPTRRIHLIPDEDGTVIGVHLCQGENFVNKEAWRDPYVTYRSNDTSVFPLRPHSGSPLWRNYSDIVDIPGDHASRMLAVYRAIHNEQDAHLTLYGVETSQASYLSVHRHDLTLPIGLSEPEAVELMTSCIAAAQQMRRTLGKASEGIRGVPAASASAAEKEYDKTCENEFWTVCEKLNSGISQPRRLYDEYCDAITKKALRIYDAIPAGLNLRAHSLAEIENKRRLLLFEIKKLMNKEENT